jgi:hypothetical protein
MSPEFTTAAEGIITDLRALSSLTAADLPTTGCHNTCTSLRQISSVRRALDTTRWPRLLVLATRSRRLPWHGRRNNSSIHTAARQRCRRHRSGHGDEHRPARHREGKEQNLTKPRRGRSLYNRHRPRGLTHREALGSRGPLQLSCARGRDPRGVAGRSIDEYRAAAVEAATKTTRRCTAQRDAFGRTLQVNESEAALLGSRARHFSGTVPCDAFTQIPGFYV